MTPRLPGLRIGSAAGIVALHLLLRLAGAADNAGMLSGTSAPSAPAAAFVLSWFALVIAAPALALSALLEAAARRLARPRAALVTACPRRGGASPASASP